MQRGSRPRYQAWTTPRVTPGYRAGATPWVNCRSATTRQAPGLNCLTYLRSGMEGTTVTHTMSGASSSRSMYFFRCRS